MNKFIEIKIFKENFFYFGKNYLNIILFLLKFKMHKYFSVQKNKHKIFKNN